VGLVGNHQGAGRAIDLNASGKAAASSGSVGMRRHPDGPSSTWRATCPARQGAWAGHRHGAKLPLRVRRRRPPCSSPVITRKEITAGPMRHERPSRWGGPEPLAWADRRAQRSWDREAAVEHHTQRSLATAGPAERAQRRLVRNTRPGSPTRSAAERATRRRHEPSNDATRAGRGCSWAPKTVERPPRKTRQNNPVVVVPATYSVASPFA